MPLLLLNLGVIAIGYKLMLWILLLQTAASAADGPLTWPNSSLAEPGARPDVARCSQTERGQRVCLGGIFFHGHSWVCRGIREGGREGDRGVLDPSCNCPRMKNMWVFGLGFGSHGVKEGDGDLEGLGISSCCGFLASLDVGVPFKCSWAQKR